MALFGAVMTEEEILDGKRGGGSFRGFGGKNAVDVYLSGFAHLENYSYRRIGKCAYAADFKLCGAGIGAALEFNRIIVQTIEERILVAAVGIEVSAPGSTGNGAGAQLYLGSKLLPVDNVNDAGREINLSCGIEICTVLELVLAGLVGNGGYVVFTGEIGPGGVPAFC